MNDTISRWEMLDRRVSQRAQCLATSPTASLVARVLAHSGDSQWWLLVGGLLWWLGDGVQRAAGVRIVVVTLVAGLVSSLVKRLVRRQRPAGPAGLLYLRFDRHSFPSGHATRTAGLALALAWLLPPWGAAALVLWGIVVGLSRVALGVHYAGDVAAGWLLGFLLGALALLVPAL